LSWRTGYWGRRTDGLDWRNGVLSRRNAIRRHLRRCYLSNDVKRYI
jgi:hypothetical protein